MLCFIEYLNWVVFINQWNVDIFGYLFYQYSVYKPKNVNAWKFLIFFGDKPNSLSKMEWIIIW